MSDSDTSDGEYDQEAAKQEIFFPKIAVADHEEQKKRNAEKQNKKEEKTVVVFADYIAMFRVRYKFEQSSSVWGASWRNNDIFAVGVPINCSVVYLYSAKKAVSKRAAIQQKQEQQQQQKKLEEEEEEEGEEEKKEKSKSKKQEELDLLQEKEAVTNRLHLGNSVPWNGNAISFSREGDMLAVRQAANGLALLDIVDGDGSHQDHYKLAVVFDCGAQPIQCSFSPDDSKIAVALKNGSVAVFSTNRSSWEESGTMQEFDFMMENSKATTKERPFAFSVSQPLWKQSLQCSFAYAVAWQAGTSGRLAVGDYNGVLRVFDSEGKEEKKIQTRWSWAVAWVEDPSRFRQGALVSCSESKDRENQTVCLWNLETEEKVFGFDTSEEINESSKEAVIKGSLCIDVDKTYQTLVACVSDCVRAYSLKDGSALWKFKPPADVKMNTFYFIRFSPDNRQIVCSGANGQTFLIKNFCIENSWVKRKVCFRILTFGKSKVSHLFASEYLPFRLTCFFINWV